MGQLNGLWTEGLEGNCVWRTNFGTLNDLECQGVT
jgi:hypothetical protein